MNTAFKIDWPKFGRDLVVIVLGVLVALGVDNWASSRADRARERDYLARLARDLRADSAMLADHRRTARMGEAAAVELLALLRNQQASAPDSLMARYFSDATRAVYLRANSPTIDELTSTGYLRVLRDVALRDALLSYYAQVSFIQRSLETVMRRGKDPLGELGWDLQAFDDALDYSVNLGRAPAVTKSSGRVDLRDGSTLLARFRAYPDAGRPVRRAYTYNGMLQPILADWERSLDALRQRMPKQ